MVFYLTPSHEDADFCNGIQDVEPESGENHSPVYIGSGYKNIDSHPSQTKYHFQKHSPIDHAQENVDIPVEKPPEVNPERNQGSQKQEEIRNAEGPEGQVPPENEL
jgi:hypothetical protein